LIGHTLAQMYPDTDTALRAARARDALLDAPGLIHWIRTLVVPSGGASDGQPKAKYRQAPVPVREGAIDDADELWTFLREWVLYWHERTATVLPPAAVRTWTVLPARTTPEEAETLTADLVRWLIAMDVQIQSRPDNPDYPGSAARATLGYWDDVVKRVHALNDRYPRRAREERPALAQKCELCGAVAVVAQWADDGSPWDVSVRCAECWWTPSARKVTDVVQWMRWADLDVEQMTPMSVRVQPPAGMVRRFTVAQAAVRVHVTERTISRWIQQGLPFAMRPTDGRTKLIREDDLTERFRRSIAEGSTP
jgi:excisionase family DNA binding protein